MMLKSTGTVAEPSESPEADTHTPPAGRPPVRGNRVHISCTPSMHPDAQAQLATLPGLVITETGMGTNIEVPISGWLTVKPYLDWYWAQCPHHRHLETMGAPRGRGKWDSLTVRRFPTTLNPSQIPGLNEDALTRQKPHQVAAWERLFTQGCTLEEIPTGGGKTFIALGAACAAASLGWKVLIIAPTAARQWEAEIERWVLPGAIKGFTVLQGQLGCEVRAYAAKHRDVLTAVVSRSEAEARLPAKTRLGKLAILWDDSGAPIPEGVSATEITPTLRERAVSLGMATLTRQQIRPARWVVWDGDTDQPVQVFPEGYSAWSVDKDGEPCVLGPAEAAETFIRPLNKVIRSTSQILVVSSSILTQRRDALRAWAPDLVIADECFRGDTPILVRFRGWIRIMDVQPGDEVASVDLSRGVVQWKPILRRMRNPLREGLIHVRFSNGSCVHVTPSHDFWTVEESYVPVGRLGNRKVPFLRRELHQEESERPAGDLLLTTMQLSGSGQDQIREVSGHFDLSHLQEDLPSDKKPDDLSGQTSSVLRYELLSDLEKSATRSQKTAFTVSHQRGRGSSRRGSGSREQWTDLSTDDSRQPNEKRGDSGKGLSHSQEDQASAEDPRWKRACRTRTPETSTRGPWGSLGDNPSACDLGSPEAPQQSSSALRDRHCPSGVNARNRGGRGEPLQSCSKDSGQPQERSAWASGLADDSGYKPRDPDRSGEGGPADNRDFQADPDPGFAYDLEVADNHNYFADRLLVSNCHELKHWERWRRIEAVNPGDKPTYILHETQAASAWWVAERASAVLLLSATPDPDRRRDLYAQYDLCDPRGWGSFRDWTRRYAAGRSREVSSGHIIWDSTGEIKRGEPIPIDPAYENELRKRAAYIHHITPRAVSHQDVPPINRQLHWLKGSELSRPGKDPDWAVPVRSQRDMTNRLLDIAAEMKRKPAVNLLVPRVLSGQKGVVLTGTHNSSERLEAEFRRRLCEKEYVITARDVRHHQQIWRAALTAADPSHLPIKAGMVTHPLVIGAHGGQGDREDRFALLTQILLHPGPALLVGTVDAWGQGWDRMQFLDFATILRLPWNQGKVLQAEGRFERIGGLFSVLVEYFLAHGTIDERLLRTVLGKATASLRLFDRDDLARLRTGLAEEESEEAILANMLSGLLGKNGQALVEIPDGEDAEDFRVDSLIDAALERGGGRPLD